VRRTWKIAGASAIFLLVLGGVQVVRNWRAFEQDRQMAILGAALQEPDFPWSEQKRRQLQLPSYVYTKDEAVKYYLASLADKHPRTLSSHLYHLGRYFLWSDCQQAVHYLRLFAERRPALSGLGAERHKRADELLHLAESQGCEVARNWLMREEAAATAAVKDLVEAQQNVPLEK